MGQIAWILHLKQLPIETFLNQYGHETVTPALWLTLMITSISLCVQPPLSLTVCNPAFTPSICTGTRYPSLYDNPERKVNSQTAYNFYGTSQ